MLMRANGRPLKSRQALPHFLYRVRVTLSNHEYQQDQNRRAIESLRENKSRVGTATTLSPLDAVRFASPEEIQQVVGHISSTQLGQLQATVNEARGLRDALAEDLTQVRNAARAVLDRPGLPSEIRLEFIRLINSLPDQPGPVVTPASLEMAQVVGLIEADDAPTAVPRSPIATPAELPDGDPLSDTPHPGLVLAGGSAPTPALTALSDHVPTRDHPLYGAAPSWVPGPGPALGS